jgi:hypothetical protein
VRKQPENASLGYSDTPFVPGTEWHVHDGTRPQPRAVSSGLDGNPPSDARVLFDGKSLSGWESIKGGPAGWKVENGYMEVVPKTGNIRTTESFGSIQLHVEFASPLVVKGKSQGRGNSGVFLMGLYEIQVLDNSDNPTYADGTVGAIYGQFPPLANPIRAPGEWNSYDALWVAPVFKGEELVEPAFLTLLMNGVVLHNHVRLMGQTGHKIAPVYAPHPPTGPLMLQDHGDLVRFRNIWVRPILAYDE